MYCISYILVQTFTQFYIVLCDIKLKPLTSTSVFFPGVSFHQIYKVILKPNFIFLTIRV